eukprot:4525904-Heterocapsa_arctica.AAC.1
MWCSLHNILGKPGAGVTPYWRRHGEDFPGEIVPFGAEIQAILPDAREKRHKSASRTATCIFVGYHWMPGQSWAGDYYVSPLSDHTASEGRRNPRVIRDQPFTYP